MEITSLLESSNGYKSLQADATRLATKWSASGLLEGLKEKEANNMAMMLENQAKQIVAEANTTGTGGTFTIDPSFAGAPTAGFSATYVYDLPDNTWYKISS